MRFPIFIEYSRLPEFFSNFAPINIQNISFFIFVFCRTTPSERSRVHETIHYKQQLELLFIFQWILYLIFWVYFSLKHGSTRKGYVLNPFEVEAYDNEGNSNYLEDRRPYEWARPKP